MYEKKTFTKSKVFWYEIECLQNKFLNDMVRMWAKVSLDILEGVDGFLDLVKALKNKRKNNFDICIS